MSLPKHRPISVGIEYVDYDAENHKVALLVDEDVLEYLYDLIGNTTDQQRSDIVLEDTSQRIKDEGNPGRVLSKIFSEICNVAASTSPPLLDRSEEYRRK